MGLFTKEKEEVSEKTSVADKYQLNRKSAAHGRPAREKAGSVRIGGKPKQATVLMSKEEKEELKRREREEGDLRDGVANAMLKESAGYRKLRKIWYFMIALGMVAVAISYISLQYQTPDVVNWANYTSVGSLIAAYSLIFTAFFLDLGKIRPLRKEAYARVSRMNIKHVEGLALEYQKKAEAKNA